jgi:hypothetical protein
MEAIQAQTEKLNAEANKATIESDAIKLTLIQTQTESNYFQSLPEDFKEKMSKRYMEKMLGL